MNQLSGSIPSFIGSSLTQLFTLNLADNQLNGTVPSSFGSLTALKELDLFFNQLTGPLPPSAAALTNLNTLFLSGSGVCGPLPGKLAASDGPVGVCTAPPPPSPAPPPPAPPATTAAPPSPPGINWTTVASSISNIYTNDLRLAPTAIRLGFHVCGTFVVATGTGGCQCPLNLTAGANQARDSGDARSRGLFRLTFEFQGFVPLITALQAVQSGFFGASFADITTLAAVVAVQAVSGPNSVFLFPSRFCLSCLRMCTAAVTWTPGRADLPLSSPACGGVQADDRLPNPMTDGFNNATTPPADRATASPTSTFAPNSIRAKCVLSALDNFRLRKC